MKKIIILIFALFISYNISFASNCKEEIIKNATNPVFSEDWKSFAYILLNDDWTKSVVINWVKWKNYHNINTFIYISKNWNSISYIAELKDWKNIVVKDWIEWKQYDLIVDNLIKYSEDWKHFAYIASKNGKQFIVKDWVEWKQYEQIATFYLSLNWKKYYIYNSKKGLKTKCYKRLNRMKTIWL